MSADHSPSDQDASASTPYAFFRDAAEDDATHAPTPRPWTLVVLALVCAVLVITGGFGPWFYLSTPAPHVLYGIQTDGLVAVIGAPVAVIALAVALIRPGIGIAAWVSLIAFAVCALAGLANWLSLGSVGSGTGVEMRWGVVVVTLAGAVGTVCAVVIARRLNRY